MIVVDASVMVSVFWAQDVNYDISRAWLADQIQREEQLVAPILILGEVAGAVTRRTRDLLLGHAAREELRAMPILTLLSVDETIGHHAAWLAVELRLHGSDATYVSIADLLRGPLVTWDAQQRQRGGQRVVTFSPSQSDGV